MEYKNDNTGSLWLSDKETIKGEKYFTGNIFIGEKEYKITMFQNKSENPKAPKFKLKVNVFKEQEEPKNERTELGKAIDKQYVDFGTSVELTDDDIDF